MTITAGPCLATCYQVGDKIFIVVLLRTSKLSRRFKETRWILGIALNKLDRKKYAQNIKQILKNDPELEKVCYLCGCCPCTQCVDSCF